MSDESPDLGRLQRIDLFEDQVVFELWRGERHLLALTPVSGALATPVTARPEKNDPPPAAQKLLREELTPGRLLSVDDRPYGGVALVEHKGGRLRSLHIETEPRDPRIVLCAEKKEGPKILAVVVGPRRSKDGRDLQKGKVYEPPRGLPPLFRRDDAAPEEGSPAAPHPAAKRPRASPLKARARAEKKRLARLATRLEQDLARHGDPAQLERLGHALKSVLHTLKAPGEDGHERRGRREVEGYATDGSVVLVPLDPARSATENLERLYHRARRARAARAQAAPRLSEVTGRLGELERLAADVDAELERAPASVDDPGPGGGPAAIALTVFLDERKSGGGHKKRVRPIAGPRRPYRSFTCTAGVVVRVGRSAKDNDDLTFHVAHGKDTWLHCRDAPGSHVIAPGPPAALDSAVLVDAAHLAAWFSEKRGEARVDVQYTERKYVKKPGKGATPGLVHVSKERVLHLIVDDERLKKLLAAEVP